MPSKIIIIECPEDKQRNKVLVSTLQAKNNNNQMPRR
jgi:hypothetical protein